MRNTQVNMDLHTVSRAAVVLVMLLRASIGSGRKCTDGFLNSLSISNYDSDRELLPLLQQNGIFTEEQWIFPSLRFTCSGRLTKWRFRAASQQNSRISWQCINIGTWERNPSSSWTAWTAYSRRTSTAERLQNITTSNDGSIITYELASPVQVEPDNVVGIELQTNSFCSLAGSGNILSVDRSSTNQFSRSSMHFVTNSKFRAIVTHPVPLIEPVIETATISETEEEPIVGLIAQGSTSTENATATTIVTDPLTNSQADEAEMSTTVTSKSGPLSTTTDYSSDTANTKEPRDKIILIIHIATGVGIGAIVLLSIAVACIGILKCMQARSARCDERSDDVEKPQIVVSSSTGILLQENTAYRMLMNRWSETQSTEGGKNSQNDIKQVQNASNSDNRMVGHETISTKEQFESKLHSAQQQDNFDSSTIVVQENTAYKKSTSSREIVTYESTSTGQNRGTESHQCANSSEIVVHKNTAYKKSTHGGDTVAGYETMDEQVMQLNQAYGLQEESQEGRANRRECVSAGDYETMTGNSACYHGGGAHGVVDKYSTLQQAEPVDYDSLSHQQSTNLEDNEHSYDYVI